MPVLLDSNEKSGSPSSNRQIGYKKVLHGITPDGGDTVYIIFKEKKG